MKRASSLAIVVAVAAGLLPASGAAWAQDAGNGQKVFNRCRACHAIGPGAHNKVGPALNGIVGRKAAAAAGFNYSDALKAKGAGGLVWTEGNLQQYLELTRYVRAQRRDGVRRRQERGRGQGPHCFPQDPEVEVAARAAPDAL